jgi:acetyl-CoA C-acetyltransferase
MVIEKRDRDPVILSAARTPVGRFQGAYAGISATRLGAVAIKAAVERAGITDPAVIDEVIMGIVVSAGLGQAPARQAAILAGLPVSVGATTINKVCGSSLKAVMLAAQAVKAGDGELFICGGMENMSRAPYLVEGRTGNLRFGHVQLTDALLNDGLWDPFVNWAMGDAAEFIADEFQITRQAMDEYAYHSHRKAIAAQDAGKFTSEIIPVEIPGKKGQVTVISTDESPRRDTTIEVLSGLKPAFKKDGKVTAGNAPSLNDGAAAVVVASRSKAEEMGRKPIAKIIGYCHVATEPKYLFDAPAKAIPNLLNKIEWQIEDLDLIELNEAFAAQVLANGAALAGFGWDWSKVNVNGGAVAIGHPIGASGARVLTTLLYALKDQSLKRGLACLCLGGAEAVALAIEMEED